MAEIITLKAADLEADALKARGTVLVDFWASWCGPCRMVSPVVDEIAREKSDIVVGKINVDEQGELAAAFNITSIPTLMAFRENVLVYSQPGALRADGLEQVIGAIRGLDMAEVHAKVAAHRAEHEHAEEQASPAHAGHDH